MPISFDIFKRKYLSQQNLVNRSFCFVLGAGASKESGIATGYELATKWFCELVDTWNDGSDKWHKWVPVLKQEFSCENRQMALSLLRNDESLLDGFFAHRSFGENDTYDLVDFIRLKYILGLSSNYGLLAKANFLDTIARDNEFQQLLNTARPSSGYFYLAEILAKTRHNIVITTNFDSLISDSFNGGNAATLRLDSAQDSCRSAFDDNNKLIAGFQHSGKRLIIKVHGDSSKGGLLNTIEETRYLPDAFYEKIASIFDNYTPIFIGYSGGDIAFMDLLFRYSKARNFGDRVSLHWFVRGEDTTKIPDVVTQFVNKAHGEFVFAPKGFDSVMDEIKPLLCPIEREVKQDTIIENTTNENNANGQTKIMSESQKLEPERYRYRSTIYEIPRRGQ